ncbi:hypothetical protein [Entomohabitans teleogrylli]|uniref:hypothetical protein n=1 Tax=Entomohabitans teleogrylli TaxID=1384589 RepID=UPI000A9F7186|nr:hypothetical protein [Entomohabitans teleogrylli]
MMKENDIFFEVLSAEFERHFAKIADSKPGIDQIIKDAEVILKRHRNGFRPGNLGNFINNNDEYIDEKGDLLRGDEISKVLKSNGYSCEGFPLINFNCPVKEFDSPLFRNGDPETSIDEFVMKAYVCYHWGIHQKNLGMHEESHSTLLQALRFLNMRDGAYTALGIKAFAEQMELERKNASSMGGNSKKKIYAPLKLKIIELLLENKPVGGWDTKKEAIDSLLSDIDKFMQEEQRKLDLEGNGERVRYQAVGSTMYKRIYDWSLKDEVIEVAFNKAVKI